MQGFNRKKQELLREANLLAPLPGKEKPTDPPTRGPPVVTTCEKVGIDSLLHLCVHVS